ncbi:putative glutamyl-trna amidotransferase subunit a [Diplodia seriata]|uniref:Putative glutamyl-trna amidotransferase subunit a n=1 Tax=Diplodia seriata TaxID=420778 RepID=A0A0G2GTR6_9PEZI|nr:putative glutamyl-trna amidotransferase subunit a [Diplodia seriata]
MARSYAVVAVISCDKVRLVVLINATIEDLQVGMEAGLFTSSDLVKAYIARINEVNDVLHAVTELNPDALQISHQLDAERSNGTTRGPLHGIPILIKNNIATRDKMNNTAGSYALLGAKVPHDSTVAAKLRKAGAVILGKTNLSQWANYRSNNSTNGWSAYGGQVTAAYYPNQDPSGSSSGSGVASDLGLALASLGTETDGSILSPSSNNNLVGIKPTVGLTSRHLVIPISEHQDTVGPMARTVKDAAAVLQAIAGSYDPADNYTAANPHLNTTTTAANYTGACNLSALAGARIGIPTNVLALSSTALLSPAELAAFASSLTILRTAGATLVPNANFSAYPAYLASSNESLVLAADFQTNLRAYLGALTLNPANVSDLAGVRAFTRSDPREAWPDRDTGVWDEALDGQGWDNGDPRKWDEEKLIGLAYAFEQRSMVRSKGQQYILPTTEIADVIGML